MTKLFKITTAQEQTSSLGSFFPQGKAFDTFDISTPHGLLLQAMAIELQRVHNGMNNLSQDYDILLTDELLTRWESAVGIPDNCFPGTGTKATRRTHVLLKFAKMNAQTATDFIQIIEELGFTVTLTPGSDAGIFPLSFPIEFFKDPQQARFTLVVNLDSDSSVFALPFPVPFTSGVNNIVTCVLDIIRPANVVLAFRFTG